MKKRPPKRPIDFDTSGQVKQRRRKLANCLQENGTVQLPDCTPGQRCNNEACPICQFRYRKHLLKECNRLNLPKGKWVSCSIVPKGLLIRDGDELFATDLKKVVGRFMKAIVRTDLKSALMLGGIDISANSTDNVFQGYQIHAYILIHGAPRAKVLSELKKAFGPHEEAYRTVLTKVVKPDEFFHVLTYAFKTEFYHRSTYFKHVIDENGERIERQTRAQALKPQQRLELYSWLAQYDIGARSLLKNIKRERTAQRSKVRLKLRSPYDKMFDGLSPGSGSEKASKRKNTRCRRVKRPSSGK